MLDRMGKPTVAACCDQSAGLARDRARELSQDFAHTGARERLTALDDGELTDWLMGCIEDGSENFLCAVAEAALAANADDYFLIRPALLALMRKHNAKHAS